MQWYNGRRRRGLGQRGKVHTGEVQGNQGGRRGPSPYETDGGQARHHNSGCGTRPGERSPRNCNQSARKETEVGYAVSAWTLMWLSLECSILSVANHINKPKGAARGPILSKRPLIGLRDSSWPRRLSSTTCYYWSSITLNYCCTLTISKLHHSNNLTRVICILTF